LTYLVSLVVTCCWQCHGHDDDDHLQVSGIMEANRQALAERGERLGQLQDQTADLAESAADFAALARQLAEKQKGKVQPGRWFG
jgi:hypothetical protein